MFLSTEVAIFVPPVLRAVGGEYAAAAWMIPVLMVSRFFVFPINFGSDICQGADKPEYRTYALIFEQTARFFSYIFMISPFGILSVIGESYAIYTYLLADLPAYLTKLIVQWWFVQKRTIKTRFSSPYQVFIAPAISVACLVPINLAFVQVFNALYMQFAPDVLVPLAVAACLLLVILFALPILLFFVYGLVGGWDEYQLRQFRNAMFISGPSKPFVKLLYNVTRWAHHKSKLGNRFPIDHEAGEREAMELTMRKARETGLKV
ncbi:MAG: hypothetical protein JW839_19535 [Candidatus Lokiarchaeota archaeon]|nr:hypothetical protein [Candidatus Lokiarchaeota archaeon]